MSMNNYQTIDDYVEKRKKDTDMQNVTNLNYLAIHVAVLQHTKGIVDKIYFKSAFDFYYKSGWDVNKALDDLYVEIRIIIL